MLLSPVLAVDSGANHVSGAWFSSADSGRLILRSFACVARAADDAADPAFARLAAHLLPSGGCRLSLSDGSALVRVIRIPDIDPRKRARLIAFEVQQAVPWPMAEVAWDHALWGAGEGELTVLLGAARTERLNALHAEAAGAGFSPERMEPAATTLYRCFDYNYPERAGEVCVIAHAGPRDLLVLLTGDGSLAMRVATGRGSSDGLTSIRERLHLEVARILSTRRGPAPVRGLFLSGSEVGGTGLASWLGERLHLPVEPLNPLRRVELSPEVQASGIRPDTPGIAQLVGLAVPVAGGCVGLDLTPPAMRRAREDRRRRPWLLASAAALALAFVLPGWQARRATAAMRGQIAHIEAMTAPMLIWRDRNIRQLEAIEAATSQLKVLEGMSGRRAGWVSLLSDLQARIGPVGDGWLNSFKVVRITREPSRKAGARESAEHRLVITGCLLDRSSGDDAGADLHDRMQALLMNLVGSPYLAGLESERFDLLHRRLLHFEATFVMNPQPLL